MNETAIMEEPRAASAMVRSRLILQAAAFWLVLAGIGVLNGIFRGLVIQQYVDEYAAHVISTLGTGLPAFALAMLLYFRSAREHTAKELALIGGLWMTMTVAFEFGFGHYVMGHSWSRLVADYNLLNGRLWVLVPIALLLGPLVFGRYLRR
jgi:hypothetical protein